MFDGLLGDWLKEGESLCAIHGTKNYQRLIGFIS